MPTSRLEMQAAAFMSDALYLLGSPSGIGVPVRLDLSDLELLSSQY
jgi:hypothetical protein